MDQTESRSRDQPTWLQPRVDRHPVQRYVETLRERLGLIFLITLLATGAATAFVLTTDKVYEAEADLLITPVPRDDPALAVLNILRDTSDPTRDVQTGARLVTTRDVVNRVKEKLNLPDRPEDILEQVDVAPIAQSNLVAITAEAGTPARARDVANAFAETAVEYRTERLHDQLDPAIAGIRDRLGAGEEGGAAEDPASLRAQLSQLETLRSRNDPTLAVEAPAPLPDEAAWPKPALSIAAGLLGGLLLGIGTAFALQALDPRFRREDQLRDRWGLPIIGRIPNERWRRRPGAKPPEELSPPSQEAYRSLRATLGSLSEDSEAPFSLLVTSASAGEGKSTTAINVATSFALLGKRVILIEADLRRPEIGSALSLQAVHTTSAVLTARVPLSEALVEATGYGGGLQVLLAEDPTTAPDWVADQFFLPTATRILDEAKTMADVVVVDSPPLGEVIDTLPLAQHADHVLVVTRLGSTHLAKLSRLLELLAAHGAAPAGFAVVGIDGMDPDSYSYYMASSNGRKAKRNRRRSASGDVEEEPAERQAALTGPRRRE